jgi:hypothetical protein
VIRGFDLESPCIAPFGKVSHSPLSWPVALADPGGGPDNPRAMTEANANTAAAAEAAPSPKPSEPPGPRESPIAGETPAAWAERAGPLIRAGAAALVTVFVVYVAVFGLRRISKGHLGDFDHFYCAAEAMLKGQDIYRSGRNGYIYPPLLAFLYTPLTVLDIHKAAGVMFAINLSLGLACVWWLTREAARRLGTAMTSPALLAMSMVTLALTAEKIRGECNHGQTNILMLCLFTAAVAWMDRAPLAAGAALGAAFNIKYMPIVALPYLLLRRRWTAAAAFAASAVGFALLPAALSGWETNRRDLGVAFGGLLALIGIRTGEHAANIEGITAGFSISITSAIARGFGVGRPVIYSVAAGAAVAALSAVAVMVMYTVRGRPVFAWPSAAGQEARPFAGLVALEWAALIVAFLVFSPQTNTRHLVLLMPMNACIAALLLFPAAGVSARPVAVGAALMMLGLTMPPGGVEGLEGATEAWHGIGGPSWCLLACLLTVFAVGLRHVGAGEGVVGQVSDLTTRGEPVRSAT